MIRVGLIGTGFIGMQHIEAIGRIPGAKIVAIADKDTDKIKRLQKLGVCENIYDDYREMIDSEDLDVIHNCTPTNMHFEINKYALERDVNVYSEKPLVMDSSQGDELISILEGRNLLTAVNFNYRNNLMVQEMRERVVSDEFGRVLLVEGKYLQDWLMKETDYDWRMDVKIGGQSRALADIGSHLFDILQFVTGQEIVKVNAKLFKSFDTRKKFKNVGTFNQVANDNELDYELVAIENEDGALVQVQFEDGVLGSLLVSQVSAGKKNDLEINISGENYALEWKQEQSDRLWIGNRFKGNEEIFADAKYVSKNVADFATLPNGHPVGWHDAFTNGIKSFYKDINEKNYSKKHTFATFEDANRILKIIDACFMSDKEGQWVDVI